MGFKKGYTPWNKGKPGTMLGKHLSKEAKRKVSLANLGNKKHFGKKHSRETKLKMSLKKIGKSSWNKGKSSWSKGKHLSIEHRNNISKGNKGRITSIETRIKMSESKILKPNKIFKDTRIELKIEAELIKRGINYQKQVPLCKVAIVDFYLPEYRIVIQADGNYWHNLSKMKEKDIRQDKVLIFNGFNVYRFWEHEINKSVEECLNRINLI